jgi:ribosomal protein L11 methyltransferase
MVNPKLQPLGFYIQKSQGVFMYQYKLDFINNDLISELENMGLDIIEDSFEGSTTFDIYTYDNLDNLLKKYGITFLKKSVENSGWEHYWKKFLKPSVLVEGISCYYDENDKISTAKSIKLIPALAFGTGTHPTTKLAARLTKDVTPGKSFLDVGCGSGILTILAVLCGASGWYAFDNDKMAVFNAKNNMEINNIFSNYLWCGDISSLRTGFYADIVCANIISSVLLKINTKLLECAKSCIILSGIQTEEMEAFKSMFDFSGLFIENEIHENGWGALRLCR